jgi:hypothetical protein
MGLTPLKMIGRDQVEATVSRYKLRKDSIGRRVLTRDVSLQGVTHQDPGPIV